MSSDRLVSSAPQTPAGDRPPPTARKRRLRGNASIYIGLGMLLAMVLAGIIIPLVSPHDPNQVTPFQLLPPDGTYLFGTDILGRDVFTRVFDAVPIDLGAAFIGVLIPFAVGTVIGTLLGISRSRVVNNVVGSIIDGINAFPFLIFVIALVAFLGAGLWSIILALSLVNWARYARIARTRAVVVNEQGYVEAARTLGYGPVRILFRHIIPNGIAPILVNASLALGGVIILESALSFLGVGIQDPTPTWGNMLSQSRSYMFTNPWLPLVPGIPLVIVSLCFNFIGDGLRDALDPRLKR